MAEHFTLKLKVVPGSSKDCIMGWLGDAIKVKIKAPPESGKANASVEKFVAKSLNIPTKNVTIKTGLTQANKLIEITGLKKETALNILLK